MSERLAAFLGLNERVTTREDYRQLVVPEDRVIFDNVANFLRRANRTAANTGCAPARLVW